jgi:hypothetical protein
MMIKKIWECIKALAKLPKLLPHRGEVREESEPAPGVLTDLDKELGQKIQRRQEKMGKSVDTRQDGPNMPRYQFCPSCHRNAKRMQKTMGGSYYKCPIHGAFFVRALGL